MRAFDICFLESLYGILGEGGLFSGGGAYYRNFTLTIVNVATLGCVLSMF